VDYNLAVPGWDWLQEVRPGDLVVLVDYFGFPGDAACAAGAQERGAWVLEDASQALFSPATGRPTHFALFSPRKFLGVPDGGILVSRCEVDLAAIPLASASPAWWLKALMATVLRREFDAHGGSRRWFDLFQEAEREQPVGRYAMSELSRLLLAHAFDYPAIAAQRVDNYRYLAGQLGNIALFPELPAEVVPLGFPLRVENRDQVRQELFAHEIYPPVHWPVAGIVPDRFADSQRLAAEIMTLPCDQRYGVREMQRMAQLVKRGLRP
jgi:dTDP-4-amino-4,6-dideoxygalactose transaminase